MATPASAGGRDARVASHSAFFQRGDARVASGAGFLDDKGFANETQGGEWVNIDAQLFEPDGGEKTAASEVSISDSNTSTCLKHLRRVAAEGSVWRKALVDGFSTASAWRIFAPTFVRPPMPSRPPGPHTAVANVTAPAASTVTKPAGSVRASSGCIEMLASVSAGS